MKTKKAGTILINVEKKQVYIIHRSKLNDYSFPKGHLELNETIEECALRETEEETTRACHILTKIDDIEYTTSNNEECICSYYLAIDDGPTFKNIAEQDKEEYILVNYEDVLNTLTYDNNKELWNKIKDYVYKLFNSIYTYDIGVKNAFLIKPFNFNHRNLPKEEFDKNIEEVKNIFNVSKIARIGQCHTDIIKEVTLDNYSEYQDGDALLTKEKNIALIIKVADCQAIMIYDPVNKVIANIHSGWRGTLKRIVIKTINLMVTKYNCDPSSLKVVINPSILQDHFEVDKDVYDLFKEEFNNIDKYTIFKNNKYYIDTVSLNVDLIKNLGINNIITNNKCTVCNGNIMHSYRYDKESSGRNLSLIVME